MRPADSRIVVGVDGSPCSFEALRWALRVALSVGAEVDALLVWSDPWSISGPPSLIGAGREGVARLRAMLAERVRRAAEAEHAESVRVTERVVPGHPAEALVAESDGARLLVVGTTGMSGLRRIMLGSVSQRCAQLSRIPTVLVPLPAEQPAPEQAEAVAVDDAGST